jgi:hypothetical protein
MPPKDLFDETSVEGQEPVVEVPVVEGKPEQEVIEPQPKTYSEKEYKSVKAEAARRRIENKALMERLDALEQQSRQYSPPQGFNPQGYQQYQQGYYPPNQPGYIPPQQPGIVYDPRVDDMQLDRVLSEIRDMEHIKDIYDEVDEEGFTFEDRLLQRANAEGYGFNQLKALAREMAWDQVIPKLHQSGIDEAYQSMKKKETSAPEKPAVSGQGIGEGEPESYEDAIRSVIKEHGVPE